jgi:hypothetical protein
MCELEYWLWFGVCVCVAGYYLTPVTSLVLWWRERKELNARREDG